MSDSESPNPPDTPTGSSSISRSFNAASPELVREISVDGIAMVRLLGPQDRLLRTIERQAPGVRVVVRGNVVTLAGSTDAVGRAEQLLDELISMVASGIDLAESDVAVSAELIDRDPRDAARPSEVLGQVILQSRGRTIRPKTAGQSRYVSDIDETTITFGIGPAGTGKTYLAMAKAVQALHQKEVDRIILSRPAIEAGERLGFLPGTLSDKIDPYLRPLYDALNEMMDPELLPKLLAAGTVEVAPLAYMRGRTLNNAFVVLDEAQNTTPEQMKMFLTRLGFGSRMVVTGDITQIDLPTGASGLATAAAVLDGIDDIAFARLTSEDVVRHTLVGRIIDAYTAADAKIQSTRFERSRGSGPGATRTRAGRNRHDG